MRSRCLSRVPSSPVITPVLSDFLRLTFSMARKLGPDLRYSALHFQHLYLLSQMMEGQRGKKQWERSSIFLGSQLLYSERNILLRQNFRLLWVYLLFHYCCCHCRHHSVTWRLRCKRIRK